MHIKFINNVARCLCEDSAGYERVKIFARVLHDKPLMFTEWGGFFVYDNTHLIKDFIDKNGKKTLIYDVYFNAYKGVKKSYDDLFSYKLIDKKPYLKSSLFVMQKLI